MLCKPALDAKERVECLSCAKSSEVFILERNNYCLTALLMEVASDIIGLEVRVGHFVSLLLRDEEELEHGRC